jgi:hypothetical protein
MLFDGVIRSANPRERHYKFTESDSLKLLASCNGVWRLRFKFRVNKVENVLARGVYPAVSLKLVRPQAHRSVKTRTVSCVRR